MTEELQNIFIDKGITLSTAESCTGGNIAHHITSLSGSSAYFFGSVVSYANSVKRGVLGVSESNLEKFGAVSQQVALEMAKGVRQLMKTDYAVATTGIAGPLGGSEQKPVGTVWIAISGPKQTKAKCFLFEGTRTKIIKATTQAAIDWIVDETK
ncbi:MAG: CinA family protein [Salibacteraceae bacterium]